MGNRQSKREVDQVPDVIRAQLMPPLTSHEMLKPQVFISHAEQDESAKMFAASILSPALEAAGLKTLTGHRDLEPGCNWPQELVEAATNSMVVVVVLSRSYTACFWRMLELDLVLQSYQQRLEQGLKGPLVIPVFYDSPDDIIKPEVIKERWSGSMVLEWAPGADRWAGNITAMKDKFQSLQREAGQFVDTDEHLRLARKVVQAAVMGTPPPVYADADVVGFEEQESAMAAELYGRQGLWIYGQGGSGKTTLAKQLFARLRDSFSHWIFIEITADDNAESTAQHLTAALKAMSIEAANVTAVPVLRQMFLDSMRDKKVLFCLDNVRSASQLDTLLPRLVDNGSVVIVTSRLKAHTDSSCWRQVHRQLYHHEMAMLDKDAAHQLFRQAAGLDGVPADLVAVEAAILETCDGLALALKCTGGQLYDTMNLEDWQATLINLKEGNPGLGLLASQQLELLDCMAKLRPPRLSMFLDAATILRGQPLERVMAVWRAWHGAGASTFFADLDRRCLLRVDEDGRLEVQGMLAALGRSIILHKNSGLEQHYGSRLWVEDDRVVGCDQAKGHRVLAAQLTVAGQTWQEEERALLQSLISDLDLSAARILQLGGVQLPPQKGVLWLEQDGTGEQWALLSPGLVALVAPRAQEAWAWEGLAALKELDMSKSRATGLLESFGLLTALQTLNLSQCGLLQALPETFGQLVALRGLDLSGCAQLSELPKSIGQLTALQTLDLSGCKLLKVLPDTFCQLAALQTVNFSGCALLEALPQSLGQLAALRTLDLSECAQLSKLPESCGQLTALQTLNLSGCKLLKVLPQSLGQLPALMGISVAAVPEECAAPGAQLRRQDSSALEHITRAI